MEFSDLVNGRKLVLGGSKLTSIDGGKNKIWCKEVNLQFGGVDGGKYVSKVTFNSGFLRFFSSASYFGIPDLFLSIHKNPFRIFRK